MASAATCLSPWCRRGISSTQINLGISVQPLCPRELRQAVKSCAASGTISTGNKGVDWRLGFWCRGQRVMREGRMDGMDGGGGEAEVVSRLCQLRKSSTQVEACITIKGIGEYGQDGDRVFRRVNWAGSRVLPLAIRLGWISTWPCASSSTILVMVQASWALVSIHSSPRTAPRPLKPANLNIVQAPCPRGAPSICWGQPSA